MSNRRAGEFPQTRSLGLYTQGEVGESSQVGTFYSSGAGSLLEGWPPMRYRR